VVVWIGMNCLRMGQVARSYEGGIEPSGSTKCWKFLSRSQLAASQPGLVSVEYKVAYSRRDVSRDML
jgi:hypothetical protein